MDATGRRCAQEAARTHEDDEDQDREHDQVLIGRRDVARRVRLAEPDQQAAEHRARDAPDPADDGGGEALQAGGEAHQREDLTEDDSEHHPAGCGERRADEEGEGDLPSKV